MIFSKSQLDQDFITECHSLGGLRHLFLIVLEAGNPKLECQHDQVHGEDLLPDQVLIQLLLSFYRKRERKICCLFLFFFLNKDTDPIMVTLPPLHYLNLITFQNPHLQMPLHQRLRCEPQVSEICLSQCRRFTLPRLTTHS